MGFTTQNIRSAAIIGLIAFVFMAIPASFISESAFFLISGKYRWHQIIIAFWAKFFHDVLLAGLPEEFFYRAFVQTRFAKFFQSHLPAILLTSTIFGIGHISSILRWYSNYTFEQAFAHAFFIQGITSIIQGVLWARTRNLLPCIMVHSGVNAVNNVEWFSNLLFAH